MRISVPKEIKPQENRIGLNPESVKILISLMNRVNCVIIINRYFYIENDYPLEYNNEDSNIDLYHVHININTSTNIKQDSWDIDGW